MYVYKAELVTHSIMWFNTSSYPHSKGYVQKILPVIHNYPLTLAFLGHIVDGSYVGAYNAPHYRDLQEVYNETGLYVFPAVFERTFHMRLTMSMGESDYILYKPQTRWAVPLITTNNVLAPGSKAVSYVISDKPLNVNYIRVGVKRGIVRVSLQEVKNYKEVKDIHPNVAYNVKDVTASNYFVLLKHRAGDVGFSGDVKRGLSFEEQGEVVYLPLPDFI
jgi:hypothetical protein